MRSIAVLCTLLSIGGSFMASQTFDSLGDFVINLAKACEAMRLNSNLNGTLIDLVELGESSNDSMNAQSPSSSKIDPEVLRKDEMKYDSNHDQASVTHAQQLPSSGSHEFTPPSNCPSQHVNLFLVVLLITTATSFMLGLCSSSCMRSRCSPMCNSHY